MMMNILLLLSGFDRQNTNTPSLSLSTFYTLGVIYLLSWTNQESFNMFVYYLKNNFRYYPLPRRPAYVA